MNNEERQEARHRVKWWLASYQGLKAEKAQIEELVAELEGTATAPGTSKWDGMPRGGSGGDALGSYLERKERLLDRYHAQLEKIATAQLAIEAAIESLPDRERRLIRYKYIQGLKWSDVCEAMYYSWGQTHNIHAAALDRLVEITGEGKAQKCD